MGCAPTSTPRLRRSTTLSAKVPRKRTFIASMRKYNPIAERLAAGDSAQLLGCRSAAYAVRCCAHNDTATPACGGPGMPPPPAGPTSPRRTGDGDAHHSSNHGQAFIPRAAIFGAAVLLLSWALAPGSATANPGRALPLRQAVARWAPGSKAGAGAAAVSGASLCLNHTPVRVAGPLPEGAIVYGQVELSSLEKRMAANSQLFLRETMRL